MSFLVKAASLRAYVAWLRRQGKLSAVMARVPPASAQLLASPPLVSSWIDARDIEPILCALEELDGAGAVLRMTRESLREDSFLTLLRPMLTAMLRLFGASPATLYRHMNDLCKTSVRGMDFAFRADGERAGTVDVSYAVEREIPSCMFLSCKAALELVPDLCGLRGAVGDPERLSPSAVRFLVAW
jgi:hypothetical protein